MPLGCHWHWFQSLIQMNYTTNSHAYTLEETLIIDSELYVHAQCKQARTLVHGQSPDNTRAPFVTEAPGLYMLM
jgi:hypothetical protein